jgi:hypothetical protein
MRCDDGNVVAEENACGLSSPPPRRCRGLGAAAAAVLEGGSRGRHRSTTTCRAACCGASLRRLWSDVNRAAVLGCVQNSENGAPERPPRVEIRRCGWHSPRQSTCADLFRKGGPPNVDTVGVRRALRSGSSYPSVCHGVALGLRYPVIGEPGGATVRICGSVRRARRAQPTGAPRPLSMCVPSGDPQFSAQGAMSCPNTSFSSVRGVPCSRGGSSQTSSGPAKRSTWHSST